MKSKLLSTNHSCAKQIIVHKPQLCKATYFPHTTAVQINLLSTQHRNLFSAVVAVNKFVDAFFASPLPSYFTPQESIGSIQSM
jgi:hypothetical protein